MTPDALRHAVTHQDLDWPADPGDLPRLLEAHADTRPGDPSWTALILACELFRTAPDTMPDLLVRDRLIRFDSLSATWLAHHADGRPHLVRVLRPDATPVMRRVLHRDGRALQGLAPIRLEDNALVLPLAGTALDQAPAIPLSALATGLTSLRNWFSNGFGPPAPDPVEVRWTDAGLVIAGLTPGTRQLNGWLRPVLAMVRGRATEDDRPLVEGLLALPPQTLDEADERLRSTMSDALTDQIVQLRTRALHLGESDRKGRLVRVIAALGNALPAPRGTTLVGYDLDGNRTSVHSDGQTIHWGVAPDRELVWDGTFAAPVARRFLRACASAPSMAEADTDPALLESLGRWVGAGLRLRTLTLLLERAP